ncbi:cytochrome c550 [Peribacillus sp. SCS-155]|uniref:cytochrome c550 n=1 Tax=Peribacillus sedimenti TaxID=3115297 RepID=UPI0039064FA1
MKNPIVPFIVIMVFGIGLMFMLSFKGIGDAKEHAEEKNGGGEKKTEQTASKPEDIYKSTCISCHGDQYQGGMGPKLKGIGSKLSEEQIKETIQNGKGAMPPQPVEGKALDAMAKFIHDLK